MAVFRILCTVMYCVFRYEHHNLKRQQLEEAGKNSYPNLVKAYNKHIRDFNPSDYDK